jgi:hypothetical protein
MDIEAWKTGMFFVFTVIKTRSYTKQKPLLVKLDRNKTFGILKSHGCGGIVTLKTD